MASKPDKEIVTQQNVMDTVETEDEPDPWDVRINNTGCAVENSRLTDCFYETRDWRKCTTEMMNFQNCWKKNNNDVRTSMKDA
ncbi:Coiled-coil-helix-coiled-coil-helix domain-containing protein [Ceratocystis fimbriata CBS 114723]|uniref:Coiled-coil-helix-coiled-coil-helix domain-containing protein n=1 Tax=Ceratocystis fimbriata CBS 114723 TaxID=1035309 RepID=A0A2C5WEQ4_9PEZI|nr:Coiled-coil-helix-coiled-coil-helix domain-containing protein [Ceratocystis fimbriata CBS 114723]